jgi:hypothetical protein
MRGNKEWAMATLGTQDTGRRQTKHKQRKLKRVYQLLAHGRWFSPGTPASPTTKPDRHAIAEILLKVALSTIK